MLPFSPKFTSNVPESQSSSSVLSMLPVVDRYVSASPLLLTINQPVAGELLAAIVSLPLLAGARETSVWFRIAESKEPTDEKT